MAWINPEFSLKTSILSGWNCPDFPLILVSTNTVVDVPASCQKYSFLSPQTLLEIVPSSHWNGHFFWLEMSWFSIRNIQFGIHIHGWRFPDFPSKTFGFDTTDPAEIVLTSSKRNNFFVATNVARNCPDFLVKRSCFAATNMAGNHPNFSLKTRIFPAGNCPDCPLKRIQFLNHKHGWRCPPSSQKYVFCVTTNTAGDALASCHKYQILSPQTLLEIVLTFC